LFDQLAPFPEVIRNAGSHDRNALANFLTSPAVAHRHLDWKQPIEWLGSSPFLLAEANELILGVLICPPTQTDQAWIRYFGSTDWRHPERTWQPLWQEASQLLRNLNIHQVATLSLSQWFDDLLLQSGFHLHQYIINLEWTDRLIQTRELPAKVRIRAMTSGDIPAVYHIDEQAFEDIWRYSLDELTLALKQCAVSTVAVKDSMIIGYQMSTLSGLSGHLARLAVLSDFQGQNIGFNLVTDLLSQLNLLGIWRVSVNTQSTNQASLSLYHRMGFIDVEGNLPVYTCPL